MPKLKRHVLSTNHQGPNITRTFLEVRKRTIVLTSEQLTLPTKAGGRWELIGTIELTRDCLSKVIALSGAKTRAR